MQKNHKIPKESIYGLIEPYHIYQEMQNQNHHRNHLRKEEKIFAGKN